MRNLIAERVKELRSKYKLTQQELADKLGLKKSTIGSWENGQNNPEIESLLKLCELFSIKIQYFFEEEYDKLNPYAIVIADANSKKISAEQLKKLIDVLDKQK